MLPPPRHSTKSSPRSKTRIGQERKRPKARTGAPASGAEAQRLLHELQVHQVELEVQNVELQEARNRLEVLLEKYTDLYDFAPIGYFSLNEQGSIQEVNLTGAALLGLDRSQLLDRRLTQFVSALTQPTFRAFLDRIFGGTGKQVCEISLRRADGAEFWANLHGTAAISPKEARQWCRISVADISSLKQAEEAQRRLEALALANRELRAEIIQRQAVELSLKRSEQRQRQLLEQSRQLQEDARSLSRRLLHVQEKERKRISRELHDEIAQTLVGIHVHLENLTREVSIDPRVFKRKIIQTQRLVEKSVDSVQRFARELRPASLDDLGLIASLHSYLKSFAKQTGIRVQLSAFSGVEQLTSTRRTALYRVAHSALTNVAQHARASRVTVNLRKAANDVCMEISDDGQAFDAERVSRVKRNVHLGLLGMRERIEMVGGNLTVESKPDHGTTIRVQIPFGKKLPKRAKRGGEWTFKPES